MHLRERFLIAMGLVACSKDKTAEPPVVTLATASATATASVAASASASATASTTASVAASATGPVGPSGGGGCGFVVVCEKPPSAPPKDAAPKPFEKCNATTASKLTGGDPHHDGPFDVDLTTAKRKTDPSTCCYKAPRAFCGGGRPIGVVAPVALRSDWSFALERADADPALADRWVKEALAEHASVAAFANVTLQLFALGAPADLVCGAQEAALDEIEHARICFALAKRRGAGDVGPGPLAAPAVETTIEAFVKDTFFDGCIGEMRAAHELREREGDAIERALFQRMADDEERHAELAWRLLAWAVRSSVSARATLREIVSSIEPDEIAHPCALALLQGLGGSGSEFLPSFQ